MNIHPKINYNEISEKIWCGTVTELIHDLHNHKITLVITVLDKGIEHHYKFICTNVFDFKIVLEHPEEDWDYVELTEVKIQKLNDRYITSCVLWSSGTLSIMSKYIELIEN